MASSDDNISGDGRHRAATETSDDDTVRICNEVYGSTSGADFAATIVEAVRAINHGIFPERIAQGSSGSYFVKNLRGVFLCCVPVLLLIFQFRRKLVSLSRRTRNPMGI